MQYNGGKYLILGISKSGRSAAEFLIKTGSECFLFEELRSEKIDKSINELVEIGAHRVNLDIGEKDLQKFDACVISPGVPINHRIAVQMKKIGKKIIGELELGYQALSPYFIAVTGTNGKTTTVSLIDQILNQSQLNHCIVGNIGYPITGKINEIDLKTVCVTEVSSFQLESIDKFKPKIACLLNISPDHLERHYTMDNYIFLKKRIFSNQDGCDYAVLNYDDPIIKSMASEIKSKIFWVSLYEKVFGAYLHNGQLFFNEEKVIDIVDIPIIGDHNIYDVLFSICSAKLLGVDNENIRSAIKSFKGVRHRLELCLEKDGIKFYNDSKSTNTASTISALSSINIPTILILGGSEKGEVYDKLFAKIKESSVKHVILTGASRLNMLNCAGKMGVGNLTVTSDFNFAVKVAKLFAVNGDAVLFSPACASFDKFSSYEERGNAFIRALGEID